MTFYLVKEMLFLMPFPVVWLAKGVNSNEIIEKNILQRHLKILTKEIEIEVGLWRQCKDKFKPGLLSSVGACVNTRLVGIHEEHKH